MPTPTRALLVVAGPPLILAAAGLAHPAELTDATARSWQLLHTLLLPVFPLLALGPWLVTRGERPALRWTVVALGYAYASFYTALDVLAGIGAGALHRAGAHEQTAVMFTQGNGLSAYGVGAYLAATLVAAGTAVRRAGAAALPGAVLVVAAAWSFLGSHIYWPVGGLTVLAMAAGWAWLVIALHRQRTAGAAAPDPGAPLPR